MKNQNGSILIVMTLVLAITALYFTTALFDIRGSVDQERYFKTVKHMTYLQIAIEDFRLNNPDDALTDLDDLVDSTGYDACDLTYLNSFNSMQTPTGWCGPYIDTSLFLGSSSAFKEDAWGTAFVLSNTGVPGSYEYTLTSYGENLVSGGSDDISRTF